MAGYVCKNCSFKTERETTTKRCPNCDRESLEKEKSAEELLDGLEGE